MALGKRLGALFSDLMNRVEKDPLTALRHWISEFDCGASLVTLETYGRALSRLATKARNSANASQIAELEDMVAKTEKAIEQARQSANEYSEFSLVFASEIPTPGRSEVAMRIEAPEAQPSPDLTSLDEAAAMWSEREWCDWLDQGFDAMQQERPNVHLSFRPLRLYPIGRYVEQLAAVFAEAADFGSPMRERVLLAIKSHLVAGRPGKIANDELYWRMYSHLSPWDPNAATGRCYVERILSGKTKEISDEIVGWICATAWDCCSNTSTRAYFFEWLLAKINSPSVAATLIAATLLEAASEKQLAEEAIPYAAYISLGFLSGKDSTISGHVDRLIAIGRFSSLEIEGIDTKIRNTSDLLKLLVRLAEGYANTNVGPWIPPDPMPLDKADIPALAGVTDGF